MDTDLTKLDLYLEVEQKRCTFATQNINGGHNMTTMTLQIPNSQVGWFEQMVRTMGWSMQKTVSPEASTASKRVYEKEVDELLSMFKTDKISQEEIDQECQLVREELYHARQAH